MLTISKKKWGRSTAKKERVVRDAIPKDDTASDIKSYVLNAKSVTPYDLASKFNIRMSVAKKMLKEYADDGEIVPFIHEGGVSVYTTPEEMEKQGQEPSPQIEVVASTIKNVPLMNDEMESAIDVAAEDVPVKPGRAARKKREEREKKAKKKPKPKPEAVEEVEEEPKKKPEKKAKPKKKEKKAPERPDLKVTEISGIGPKTADSLTNAGFDNVRAISEADPDELADKVDGVGSKGAADMVYEAKKMIQELEGEELPEISDIKGIGPTLEKRLILAHYDSVKALADAESEEVAQKVEGITVDGAKRIIKEAKDLLK